MLCTIYIQVRNRKTEQDKMNSLLRVTVATRPVARTLIGGGGAYSCIHVWPDEFLFKSNSNFSI